MGSRLAAGQDPAACRRQARADLRARTIAGLPPPDESLARLEDQRLHLLLAHTENGRDLGLRVVAELEQHERGALIERQPVHVLQQLAELLAPLQLLGWAVERRTICRDSVELDHVPASPQLRQAAVAGDRVQPWPQREAAIPVAQREIGGHECQLQRVLSAIATSEHLRAERQHRGGVPVIDRLERGLIATADARNELVVAVAAYCGPPFYRATWPDRCPHGTHYAL